MDILFGYLAGLLTLLNPCVLPVLPIVLATASAGDRRGPLFLMAGMSASFVLLGLALARLGPALGLRPESVEGAAALAMIGFGLVLLVPAFNARFATATTGLAARADAGFARLDRARPWQMALGGALLGAVWSPCIGPTLGGAIALASTGDDLVLAGAIMLAFAAGVSSIMLALAYGAREALARRAALLRRLSARAKPVIGISFVLIGTALWFGLHKRLEFWAIETLPDWFNDLSILI
ncbi:cytochrome c biogenesis CcdA family protein [Pararhodobacter marinus]|uniref:cytochrome c biogenesis CcdA family protein n=1 Tax=Pararhodobacter marinus TaxID=2184063 RepID=UPI003516558F